MSELTSRAAEIRLAQYGERGKPSECGNEKALYEIALALQGEIDRLRGLLQTNELLNALRLIHEDMDTARKAGDEWASEWLNDLWVRLPLKLRAIVGDDEALSELAANGGEL